MTAAQLQKNRAAIHGILFFVSLAGANAVFPSLLWPWHLLLPLIVYGGIVLVVGPLRRTAPKLAMGRLGGWPLAYAAALALTTTGVLLGFEALVQPDAKALAATLPVAWFGNLLMAGVCFSVLNAALEEVVFRGVLWDLVSDEWSQGVALVVTSALFGVGHILGYPPGPIGAVLAGLYGVALGVLRWWTGGLGLAVICHVGADATIFWILASTGAFNTL